MTEITREEYKELFKQQKLVPFQSFTDIDGIAPYGIGRPYIKTVWGSRDTDEKVCMATSERESAESTVWIDKFYKY